MTEIEIGLLAKTHKIDAGQNFNLLRHYAKLETSFKEWLVRYQIRFENGVWHWMVPGIGYGTAITKGQAKQKAASVAKLKASELHMEEIVSNERTGR